MRKGALTRPFSRTPRWDGAPVAAGVETRKKLVRDLAKFPGEEAGEVAGRIASERTAGKEAVALV